MRGHADVCWASAACILLLFAGSRASGQTGRSGKELFEKRCTGCHALDQDKEGPRLRGVFGRPAASIPSFLYSEPLRHSGVVWNSNSLDKWLTDPDRFIPDADMAFRVAIPEERTAIIQYLKELSGK